MNRSARLFLYSVCTLSLILPQSSSGQYTLEEKIAQMIMVSYSPDTFSEDTLYYDIEHRNLGGVIFFAYNVESPEQVAQLTDDLQSSATTPLFIAIDQEGGIVARLDENNGYQPTSTAYHLGTEVDNEDSTRAQAATMAGWLRDAGINMNLAPVVDVNVNPVSPAIGFYGRSFSSDPLAVSRHAGWFISEFAERDIINVLKHFPGHGSAEQDSHLGFTDVTTTWADSELVPYRELIDAGYQGMIMTAHIFNSNLDPEYPASLSHNTIAGMLRDSLGFNGVVVSDAMFMRAISDNYGFEQALVLAINAGTDILLYTNNLYNGVSLLDTVTYLVQENIQAGVITEDRIDASFRRIMAVKNRTTALASSAQTDLPRTFSLKVFPNPFNNVTTIAVTLPQQSDLDISIYDINGRRVYKRNYTWLPAGKHNLSFSADHLASGIYFLNVNTLGRVQTAKLVLIK